MSLTQSYDANLITYNSGTSAGIYVGASSVVNSSNSLWFSQNNINGVLNVAFDVDDPVFNTSPAVNITSILFAKVGLVDTGPTPGYNTVNQAQTLIAAVYALDQLKSRGGWNFNVLVHCCSGGSRSVAVAALWMAQRLPIIPFSGQTRFETALNTVRNCRGYGPAPYDPTNPNAAGSPGGTPYSDGKPMAAHFYMAQAIDQNMNLFPSLGDWPPTGWPAKLTGN